MRKSDFRRRMSLKFQNKKATLPSRKSNCLFQLRNKHSRSMKRRKCLWSRAVNLRRRLPSSSPKRRRRCRRMQSISSLRERMHQLSRTSIRLLRRHVGHVFFVFECFKLNWCPWFYFPLILLLSIRSIHRYYVQILNWSYSFVIALREIQKNIAWCSSTTHPSIFSLQKFIIDPIWWMPRINTLQLDASLELVTKED